MILKNFYFNFFKIDKNASLCQYDFLNVIYVFIVLMKQKKNNCYIMNVHHQWEPVPPLEYIFVKNIMRMYCDDEKKKSINLLSLFKL